VYAESILKICEFCVGSPMTCVSGVTGADLKKRIFHIMTEDITRNLDFSKKLLLAFAGLLALATPIAFGLLHPTQTHAKSRPQSSAANTIVYDTISIKPSAPTETNREFLFGLGTFSATMTVRELIAAI
jgi:bla regulator protein BlaR1